MVQILQRKRKELKMKCDECKEFQYGIHTVFGDKVICFDCFSKINQAFDKEEQGNEDIC